MLNSTSHSEFQSAKTLETLDFYTIPPEQPAEKYITQLDGPPSVFSLFPPFVFELGMKPPVAKAYSSWKPPPPDSHRSTHGRIRHHHVVSSSLSVPSSNGTAFSPSAETSVLAAGFTHSPYGDGAEGLMSDKFVPEPGILPFPSPNVSSISATDPVSRVSSSGAAHILPGRNEQSSFLQPSTQTPFSPKAAAPKFQLKTPHANVNLHTSSPSTTPAQPLPPSKNLSDDWQSANVLALALGKNLPSLEAFQKSIVQPDLSSGFETIQASSQRLHHMISRVADPPERSHPSWQPPTPNQPIPQPGVQSHTSIAPAQPLPPPQFVAHQAPFFSESVDPSAYFHNLSRPDQNCVTPIDPSLPLNPHVSDTMRFPSFFSFIPQPGVLPYPDVGTNSVSSQDVNIPLGTKLSFSQLQGQHIHPPRNLAAGCPYKHASPESRRESSDDALSLDTAAMPTIRQGVKQDSRSEKSLRRRVKKPDSNDTATSSSSLSPLPLPPFRDPSLTLENASGGGLRASPAQSHTPAQRVLQRPSHLQHHTQLKQQPNKFRSGGPRQT